MFKNTVLSSFLFALLLADTLAAARGQEPAKPELKVGFVPGPYIDEPRLWWRVKWARQVLEFCPW